MHLGCGARIQRGMQRQGFGLQATLELLPLLMDRMHLWVQRVLERYVTEDCSRVPDGYFSTRCCNSSLTVITVLAVKIWLCQCDSLFDEHLLVDLHVVFLRMFWTLNLALRAFPGRLHPVQAGIAVQRGRR